MLHHVCGTNGVFTNKHGLVFRHEGDEGCTYSENTVVHTQGFYLGLALTRHCFHFPLYRPMWLYLQWGSMGPVHDILVENNWHNQTVAGGCAMPEHKATCPKNLTIQNNTLVSGSNWPADALAVAAAAGAQSPVGLF